MINSYSSCQNINQYNSKRPALKRSLSISHIQDAHSGICQAEKLPVIQNKISSLQIKPKPSSFYSRKISSMSLNFLKILNGESLPKFQQFDYPSKHLKKYSPPLKSIKSQKNLRSSSYKNFLNFSCEKSQLQSSSSSQYAQSIFSDDSYENEFLPVLQAHNSYALGIDMNNFNDFDQFNDSISSLHSGDEYIHIDIMGSQMLVQQNQSTQQSSCMESLSHSQFGQIQDLFQENDEQDQNE